MFDERSHYCGNVDETHEGTHVNVFGWVDTRRDHGGVIFIDLRDYKGIVQVVFDSHINSELHVKAEALRNEYVIGVRGKVIFRDNDKINDTLPSGKIEIEAEQLEIYSKSEPLPFQINNDVELGEQVRLKYRYLDLRRPEMNEKIRLRSLVSKRVRDYMYDRSFHEIETPVLTKSTPEGARDYLVPSRVQTGKFYALPQSPQIFKQLLMVSGMDRYFQIVRCFRDEDLRGNRQPEFTQIDIEMSFPTFKIIKDICDNLIRCIFDGFIDPRYLEDFPVISYNEAMESYGRDAPDLRYDLKLVDLTEIAGQVEFKVFADAVKNGGIVKAIRVPEGARLSRKDLDDLTEVAKTYKAKGMAWVKITDGEWHSPIAKFIPEDVRSKINEACSAGENDLLLFGADRRKIVHDALGRVRESVADLMGLVDENEFKFVWVNEFPLFEEDDETGGFHSCHHPFTMPDMEDLEKYGETDPIKVRAHAYDLVLNGEEIGGGSIRIHDSATQARVFKLLGLSEEEVQNKFGFLIEAMKYGAPPHGGLAFGFDRLMMFICKTQSIRDVIAFPKTQQASCLLTEAPSEVSKNQLKELGLILRQ